MGIGLLFALILLTACGVAFWWMGRVDSEVCHPAPVIPFTSEEAHAEMQERINCDSERCARKRAAFQTLIDVGHATPGRRP